PPKLQEGEASIIKALRAAQVETLLACVGLAAAIVTLVRAPSLPTIALATLLAFQAAIYANAPWAGASAEGIHLTPLRRAYRASAQSTGVRPGSGAETLAVPVALALVALVLMVFLSIAAPPPPPEPGSSGQAAPVTSPHGTPSASPSPSPPPSPSPSSSSLPSASPPASASPSGSPPPGPYGRLGDRRLIAVVLGASHFSAAGVALLRLARALGHGVARGQERGGVAAGDRCSTVVGRRWHQTNGHRPAAPLRGQRQGAALAHVRRSTKSRRLWGLARPRRRLAASHRPRRH